jgi:hypothetical protein
MGSGECHDGIRSHLCQVFAMHTVFSFHESLGGRRMST